MLKLIHFLVATLAVTPSMAMEQEDTPGAGKENKIAALPEELQQAILQQLDPKSLAQMSATSKHFNRQANEEWLWKILAHKAGTQAKGEDHTWKEAYILSTQRSSFWDLKTESYFGYGCKKENQDTKWCQFLRCLTATYKGIAFIKKNDGNHSQVGMLENFLSNFMASRPLGYDGVKRYNKNVKNVRAKIQSLRDHNIELSYRDFKQMVSDSEPQDVTTEKSYVRTLQEGAKIMDRFYPLQCKKIDAAINEGKDGMIKGYKFKIMLTPESGNGGEAEVEFYLFPYEG